MLENECLAASLDKLAALENYYRWILEEIRPFLGNRVVEIGAGTGTFTKFLVTAYLASHPAVQLSVFEPSEHHYRKLYETLHSQYPGYMQADRLTVTQGYFHTSPEGFDTIVMINVLEHIEHDLEAVLTVHHSLASGGTYIVFVPALQWLYSPFDKAVGHYRRYEKTHLEEVFRKGGFTVVKAKYMDCLGVLPWYLLNVLGGSQSINPRLARLYDTWLVPVTKWAERLGEPCVGKNILMIGRKIV
jgi:phospholipid N-methyltransferase